MSGDYAQLFPQPKLDGDVTKGRFKGKVAIVTGGASGIGKETVRRFLNDGATVAVFDINDEAIRVTDAEFKELGFKVEFYSVDVSDKAQCVSGVSKVADAHGGIVHYLVNGAVYFGSQALEAEKKDWDRTMAVNVQGVSNMVQSCHSYMVKAGGNECAVVNMASISAHRSQKCRWTYSASKGAILSLTKCMALELSQDGIRVNSVSPAWIWSPEGAKAVEFNRAASEKSSGNYHMLRRFGEMAECAAVITFLCSKDASFLTATDYPIDGGYLALSAEGFGQSSAFAGSTSKTTS